MIKEGRVLFERVHACVPRAFTPPAELRINFRIWSAATKFEKSSMPAERALLFDEHGNRQYQRIPPAEAPILALTWP